MAGAMEVNEALLAYTVKLHAQIETGMAHAMTEAENQSKQGAPWQDRTGNARNSIFGQSERVSPTTIMGYHGIGVFYGKYLELSNQGKYRIIWPTTDAIRPKLIDFLLNG